MVYKGEKFNTTKIPSDKDINELKNWCKIFHEKGFAPEYPGGSYGNLSMRIIPGEDMFLITASRSSLENPVFEIVHSVNLDLENVYQINNGEIKRKPSSEAMIHGSIYNERKDINAIFHGHCREISEKVQELGIRETKREVPYGTIELVEQVLSIIGHEYFIEMKNHGFIAMGKTLKDAGNLTLRTYKKLLRL